MRSALFGSIAALVLAARHADAAPAGVPRAPADATFEMPLSLYNELHKRQDSQQPNPRNSACVKVSPSDLYSFNQDLWGSIIQNIGGAIQIYPLASEATNNAYADNDQLVMLSNRCIGSGGNGNMDVCNWSIDPPLVADINRAVASGYNQDLWLYACPSTPVVGAAVTSGSCSETSQNLTGSLSGTGADITTTIDRQLSFAFEVDDSSSQTFSQGMSFEVTGGVENVAQFKTTVSFSYEYSSSHGVSNTTTTSDDETVSVTIHPQEGQSCVLEVTNVNCQASVPVTVPVTFQGSILVTLANVPRYVHFASDYAPCVASKDCVPNTDYLGNLGSTIEYPEGLNIYELYGYFFDFQTLINKAIATDPTQEVAFQQVVSGPLHGIGSYDVKCYDTATGLPSTPETDYQPLLTCPPTLPSITNACSWTPIDYITNESGGVQSDWQNWATNSISRAQSPAAGQLVNKFGTQTVTFTAIVPANSSAKTVTCTSQIDVIPESWATFTPQQQTVSYSSDASPVYASVDVEYNGNCARQAGSCYVSNILSHSASHFSWSQTSDYPASSSFQTFQLSNGGQPWPQTDQLTWVIECSDAYGGVGGGGAWKQQAQQVPTVAVSLPGATATTTLNQATVAASTAVYTVPTTFVTPTVTKSAAQRVAYTGTSYTKTVSTSNGVAHRYTSTVTSTRKAVSTTHVTVAGYQTVDYASPFAATATAVVTKTPTIISTIYKGATRTDTSTTYMSTCTPITPGVTTIIPKRSLHPRQFEYAPTPASTGTTSITMPTLTTTVTDSVDTQTVTLPTTTTSFDMTDYNTRIASTTKTTTVTPTLSTVSLGALTVYGKSTTVFSTAWVTSTSLATATVTTTPPAITITMPPSGTTTVTSTSLDLVNALRKSTTITTRVAHATVCVVP